MTTEAQRAVDRVWLVLDAVAVMQPNLPLRDARKVVQETYAQIEWARATGLSTPPELVATRRKPLADVDLSDPADLGTWLAGESLVTDYVQVKKMINAIKEARAITGAGLKEAKGAVEYLRDNWARLLPTRTALL